MCRFCFNQKPGNHDMNWNRWLRPKTTDYIEFKILYRNLLNPFTGVRNKFQLPHSARLKNRNTETDWSWWNLSFNKTRQNLLVSPSIQCLTRLEFTSVSVRLMKTSCLYYCCGLIWAPSRHYKSDFLSIHRSCNLYFGCNYKFSPTSLCYLATQIHRYF